MMERNLINQLSTNALVNSKSSLYSKLRVTRAPDFYNEISLYHNDVKVSQNFYIGLSLAVSSSVFIGASFIIKKKGLLKISREGQIRAVAVGEGANFAAYAFAPATLVTPLGALSVLVSALLASKFLGERLNLLGKIGCLLCVLGSTVMVLHAPKEGSVATIEELGEESLQSGFVNYVIFVVVVSFLMISYCVPRYGNSNVIVHIVICSVIGSLSVMGCKGVGLALRETVAGTNKFTQWITWFCIFSVVICVTVQMNYLNKALDLFNTSVVTPIYYVFFTSFVIVASAILFREWGNMSAQDILGTISGFLIIICAIFLLNGFKDWDINLASVNSFLHRREGPPVMIHGETTNTTSLLFDSHSNSIYGDPRRTAQFSNFTPS
ncbi:magnesium transporter NIPA2-like isoform X3 [Tachypleus tridentatus]|uniref:magnesium transporter NIPA2-like isoform X3 n=1 Tax=Tachypleus tridentatus TaxID=6853 RepID=UPI003FD293B9